VVPVKPTRSAGALEATRRVLEVQEAPLLTRQKPRGVQQENRGLDAKIGKRIKCYLSKILHFSTESRNGHYYAVEMWRLDDACIVVFLWMRYI
jgi:hypothetical protein